MNEQRKITVLSVLNEGYLLGVKNAASIIVATILWLVTIWIPYLNVGTTIAMAILPVALSKGKVISPFFIFEGKYRQYMGEYFNLIGLMSMSLMPAFLFMIVPGIIISIGWSLAIYLLLDKAVSPSEAMIMSNKATYGYKWTIFGVNAALIVLLIILYSIISSICDGGLLAFLFFVLILLYTFINIGCSAVIYKNLTADETA